MKHSSWLALSILCLTASIWLYGCDSTGSKEVIRVVTERDSLMRVAQTQQRQLTRVNSVLTTLSEALDSVQEQEKLLFVNTSGEGKISKAEALDNLNRFELAIKSQQAHINRLEKQLAESREDEDNRENDSKTASLIENMRQQLRQKDELIATLRQELDRKNVDISNLQAIVAKQKTQISNLGEQNKRYTEALARSTDMANRGFVAMGTKKELEAKGIIHKGKIQTKDALDRGKFSQVDIRKFTEITFEAKKPKILTAAPQSTYTLTTDGKGSFTLHINNVAEFWSISNFLVIQTR